MDDQQEDQSVSEDGTLFSSFSSSREREVFRLLEPWQRQSSRLFQPVSTSDTARATALGCDDTALSAFAQLGAFRLNSDRCMVILFGREHEYILAESTRTLSLQSDAVHGARDALWVGTASISRSEGISQFVMDGWQDNPSRDKSLQSDHYHTQGHTAHMFLVNDLRQSEDYRRILPGYSSAIRFLVAIPLRSYRGHVLGAYVVVDTIPRYGISESELAFLEDMGKTVINHLHAIRATNQKESAERLIKGLGVFTQGGSSLRDWWYGQWESQQQRSRIQDRDESMKNGNRERLADEEFGSLQPNQKQSHRKLDVPKRTNGTINGRHSPSSSVHDFAQRPGYTREEEPDKKSPTLGVDLEQETSGVLARASNLIREAMGADGVLVLDAGFTRSNTSGAHGRQGKPMESTDDSDGHSHSSKAGTATSSNETRQDQKHDGASTDDGQAPSVKRRRRKQQSMYCKPLGYCTRIGSSLNDPEYPENFGSFPQSRMERLVRRYPCGKVLNFSGDDGTLETSSGQEDIPNGLDVKATSQSPVRPQKLRGISQNDAKAVESICKGARSVAFVPLWDAHREKWRAGIFVWTSTPGKYLTLEEDITYLSAFAESISGGLTRVDMLANDQAKATFISTISHELRSPLHGVISASDYLLTTELSSLQIEMASTIKTAAGTLLDTINAILDFTKLNAIMNEKQNNKKLLSGVSTRPVQQLDREDSSSSDSGNEAVDIGMLTESVVNTIVAGKVRRASLEPSGSRQDENNSVQVILDIHYRSRWMADINSGVWTRIVTNLVSNSLKYSEDGYVHIRLSSTDDHLTLVVQDTGCGMSEAFQKHHMYTAFKQEDPLAHGTGLGLFIVNQLVSELKGDIVVESNRGENHGTKVLVTIPITFNSDGLESHAPSGLESIPPEAHVVLLSRSPAWGGKGAPYVRSSMLQSSVKRMCRDWLGVDFQIIERIEDATNEDVCLIVESDFLVWWKQHGRERAQQSQLPHVIVLTEQFGSSLDWDHFQDALDHCMFLDPPFGPRKLSRVLHQVLHSRQSSISVPCSPGPSPRPRYQRAMKSNIKHGATPQPNLDKRVLLVEDNDLNMRLLVAWSRKLGLSFVEAANGLEAVRAYSSASSPFDLILMDISMPVMDGFTATNEIRTYERRNGRQRCKIIALTGVDNKDARTNATKAGVDEFIVKPASLAKLAELFD